MTNFYYGQLHLYEPLELFSRTETTADPTDGLEVIYRAVNTANKTRSKNYVLDELFMDRAVCYSTTYIEDDFPALASVAWIRPMYNGIVRLCTRYCVHPDLGNKNFGKGTDGMRLDTMDHITQQVEFCQGIGYTDFFIGREDKSKGRRSRKIAKKLTEHTGMSWECSQDLCLVAPDPKAPDCWQYVIYNNRKDFDYENIPV